jgi:hypothetical protein
MWRDGASSISYSLMGSGSGRLPVGDLIVAILNEPIENAWMAVTFSPLGNRDSPATHHESPEPVLLAKILSNAAILFHRNGGDRAMQPHS